MVDIFLGTKLQIINHCGTHLESKSEAVLVVLKHI